MVIDLKVSNLDETRKIVKNYLLKGSIVVIPTDTIDGISARADDMRAVAKVYKIKKREKDKSLLILVASMNMLRKYCHLNSLQEQVLKEIWQQDRPTSVLLKQKKKLASNLSSNDFLAVRLPKNDFLRKLIKSLGVPIVSTSLNLSGQKNMSAGQALKVFKDSSQLSLVVNDHKNKYSTIKASRLLSIDKKGALKIIRN